jgi:hypothetical protein
MVAMTFSEAGLATAAPAGIAILLVLSMWRVANGWRVLTAWLCGAVGAFKVHEACLRKLPSLLPEGQLDPLTAGQAWLSAFVEAAIPEELSKGLFILVLLVAWRSAGVAHGALVGGLVGLGFAWSENMSYAQVQPEWRLMAVVLHAAWGIMVGRMLELALGDSSRRWWGAAAIVAAIALHGLVDAGIFLVDVEEYQLRLTLPVEEAAESVTPAMAFWMATTFATTVFSVGWALALVWRVRTVVEAKAPDEYSDARRT